MKITRRQLRRIILEETREMHEAAESDDAAYDMIIKTVQADTKSSALKLFLKSAVRNQVLMALAVYKMVKGARALRGAAAEAILKKADEAYSKLDPRIRGPIDSIVKGASELPDALKDTALDGIIGILEGLKSDSGGGTP